MRFALVSSILVLAACGGSKKPAESASESSQETATPAGGDNSDSDAAAPAASEPSSSGSSSAAASAEAPAEPPASESAPSHPSPAATGSIDGKPFAPKLARVTSRMQKDGRILLTLDERSDCASGGAKPGEGVLTMLVPWENGYKVDLGALKHSGKKGAGEIAFSRINKAGKKTPVAKFKASGRMTIVKAPMEQNAVGKMKIDLQSGDYMLAGDLDIQVCVSPK